MKKLTIVFAFGALLSLGGAQAQVGLPWPGPGGVVASAGGTHFLLVAPGVILLVSPNPNLLVNTGVNLLANTGSIVLVNNNAPKFLIQ